jgi:transcriptional regulator with XRE-family HTH domain
MLMLAVKLQNSARDLPYRQGMEEVLFKTRATLKANLLALKDRRGWTQTVLEDKSGVSQRHVSSLLNAQVDPSTEILDKLGVAFGVPGWLLLIPGIPVELLDSQKIPLLIRNYIDGGPEEQALVDSLADRGAYHNKERRKVVPFSKSK